jgi:hypothetical protein
MDPGPPKYQCDPKHWPGHNFKTELLNHKGMRSGLLGQDRTARTARPAGTGRGKASKEGTARPEQHGQSEWDNKERRARAKSVRRGH